MTTKVRTPGSTFVGGRAWTMGKQNTMVNPTFGGQFGHMSDVNNYINYAPYLKRNSIPVLVEAPRGFLDQADSVTLISTLKALVEVGYRSFDGLNQTLESTFTGTELSGDGNQIEVMSDMKMTISTPTYTYVERYGRPIGTFFDWWRTEYGMDPQTKTPNIITRGVRVPDLLPDYTTMTMLFFEPDATWQHVDKAWLCFNMFPKQSAPIEGYRDLNRAGELVEFTVEFTCIQQVSDGVIAFAQSILETINLRGANSWKKPSANDQIGAQVSSKDSGFINQIDRNRAAALP